MYSTKVKHIGSLFVEIGQVLWCCYFQRNDQAAISQSKAETFTLHFYLLVQMYS